MISLRERRQGPREPAIGRVRWGKSGGQAHYSGWLSDRTSTSLSIIVGRHVRPRLNERVIIEGSGYQTTPFRVRRIAPYGRDLLLLGCSRVAESDVRPSRRE